MHMNQYQELAERTLIDGSFELPTKDFRLIWNAMGVAGEAAEVAKLVGSIAHDTRYRLRDEAGDLFWYLAASATVLERPMSHYTLTSVTPVSSSKHNPALTLCVAAGEYLDYIKKACFHQHGVDEKKAFKLLEAVYRVLAEILDNVGLSHADCFEFNIDKLKRRYPEGFSSEASANREETAVTATN